MTPLTLTDPASAATGGSQHQQEIASWDEFGHYCHVKLFNWWSFYLFLKHLWSQHDRLETMLLWTRCHGPRPHNPSIMRISASDQHPGHIRGREQTLGCRVILLAPRSVFQSVSYANHKYLISCLWRLNLYNRDQSLESLVHCNILCGYSGPAAKTRDFDIDHFDAAWYQDIGGQPPAQ